MKLRGILFSPVMVRALLAGVKWQTRRLLRLQKYAAKGDLSTAWPDNTSPLGPCLKVPSPHDTVQRVFFPISRGDYLWVREAWRTAKRYDHLSPAELPQTAPVEYLADGAFRRYKPSRGRYRQARFMPKLFSRLTLELTEVRVERLNAISGADARAEGALFWAHENTPDDDGPPVRTDDVGAKAWFETGWKKINGHDSWAPNPWVWVLSFKRIG